MVRILKVKSLEERRHACVAKSEMYRQTMRLEVANVKYSVALWRRKHGYMKILLGASAAAVPLAGILAAKRKAKKAEASLWQRLMGGYQLFNKLKPVIATYLKRRREPKPAPPPRQNLTQYP